MHQRPPTRNPDSTPSPALLSGSRPNPLHSSPPFSPLADVSAPPSSPFQRTTCLESSHVKLYPNLPWYLKVPAPAPTYTLRPGVTPSLSPRETSLPDEWPPSAPSATSAPCRLPLMARGRSTQRRGGLHSLSWSSLLLAWPSGFGRGG